MDTETLPYQQRVPSADPRIPLFANILGVFSHRAENGDYDALVTPNNLTLLLEYEEQIVRSRSHHLVWSLSYARKIAELTFNFYKISDFIDHHLQFALSHESCSRLTYPRPGDTVVTHLSCRLVDGHWRGCEVCELTVYLVDRLFTFQRLQVDINFRIDRDRHSGLARSLEVVGLLHKLDLASVKAISWAGRLTAGSSGGWNDEEIERWMKGNRGWYRGWPEDNCEELYRVHEPLVYRSEYERSEAQLGEEAETRLRAHSLPEEETGHERRFADLILQRRREER